MMKEQRSAIDHLEDHLGPIECGWSKNADGKTMPFQVVRLPGGPLEGYKVFSTLGLGQWPLRSRSSAQLIQHELILIAPASFGDRTIPGLLEQVGQLALRTGEAFLRGDVVGPRGPLFAGSAMQALYLAIPVYLPDSFAVYRPPASTPIVFAWLVPISASEANYIDAKGWNAFEDALLRLNPDLADPMRPSLALLD